MDRHHFALKVRASDADRCIMRLRPLRRLRRTACAHYFPTAIGACLMALLISVPLASAELVEQLPSGVHPNLYAASGAYGVQSHYLTLQGKSDGSGVGTLASPVMGRGITRCDGTTHQIANLDGSGDVATSNPASVPPGQINGVPYAYPPESGYAHHYDANLDGDNNANSGPVTRCNSGGRIVIAVIDDGVNHALAVYPNKVAGANCGPARQHNTTYGYRPCAAGSAPSGDSSVHGSMVASVALANGSLLGNYAGYSFSGVAPGAALMPIEVGQVTDYYVANSIRWAVDHGADVINLSLGFDTVLAPEDFPPLIQSSLAYAKDHGVIATCAAGNGAGGVEYPASDPNCIAVTAINTADMPYSVNSTGPEVDFTARGQGASVANSFGGAGSNSGTSFAAPAVAGAAALLLANGVGHPSGADATIEQSAIYTALKSSAQDLGTPGRDNAFGWGHPKLGNYYGLTQPTYMKTYPCPDGSTVEVFGTCPVIDNGGGDSGGNGGGTGTGGTGTGGNGNTDNSVVQTCAATSISVPILGRVSLAGRTCTALGSAYLVQSSPSLGTVAAGSYVAPTNRIGATSFTLRSADGRWQQTINVTITKQRLKLAKPSIKCGVYKLRGKIVRTKKLCKITSRVTPLAGGDKAVVKLQRRVKVGKRFVWRSAGTCALTANGKSASCSRVVVLGLHRVQVTVAKTGLRDAAASAFVQRAA